MGFKFAGTSPGNSAENYSAVATDGYNDEPSPVKRTVVCTVTPVTCRCCCFWYLPCHLIRASQIAARASSSRTVETAGGTTDGAVVAEDITEDVQIVEDTTEGVQIAEDVGSGKPDPPAC